MYYLVDLSNEARMAFENKVDLLAYWRFRSHPCYAQYVEACPLNFDELNVTGNDMFASPYIDARLRRFQVLDEYGRSVDIRTWTKEISIVNAMRHFPWKRSGTPMPRFRREPAGVGCKMPDRKGRYSAFTKQRLRDKRGTLEFDFEDELLGFTPVKDQTKPRVKERRRRRANPDAFCWKSSTKNTSQWGRHSERSAEMPIRKRFPTDFDPEALMNELAWIA